MQKPIFSDSNTHSRHAAIALGMSLPGDTLLYLILPMFASAFGVSLLEAGLLLAANRLVRIVGYGYVAKFYAKHGDRLTCSLAVSVASICALGYASLKGFVALLVLRLMWGLAFAALNLATQALATAEPAGAAVRTGRSRAITALGPMLALPLGAACAIWLDPKIFFFVLAGLSFAALLVTRKLPTRAPHELQSASSPSVKKLPSSMDTWSFIEGLVLDGLFIIGLSYLGRDLLPGEPVLVAGLLLASRYLAEILLASAGGRMADKYGAEKLLLLFSLLTAVALVGFGLGWLWTSALAIMILRALLLPLPAPLVALRIPGAGRIQALAARSVWRDIGAGTGPVLASLLLPIAPAIWIYSASACLFSLAALVCYRQRHRANGKD
jgi:MFS transporter, DHA1 family, inner membrane transport protein